MDDFTAMAIIAPVASQPSVVQTMAERLAVDPFDIVILIPPVDRLTIGIAAVRDWAVSLFRTPRGVNRLAVIYQAERLTTEAANYLLKLLEEPPAHTQIVLMMARDQLLTTIRSRVQLQYESPATVDQPSSFSIPTTVSDIIHIAEETAKKRSVPDFFQALLPAVRYHLRQGSLTAAAADSVQQLANSYRPGMSAKAVVETALLTLSEGSHDS